jgi:hypothetical protein
MTTKRCTTCTRGPQHFDGCSHVECPNRRLVTAQAFGESYNAPARGVEGRVIACDAGLRREPKIREIE